MKTHPLTKSLALLIGLSSSAVHAETSEPIQAARAASSVFGTAILGAAVGGPVGFVVGGVTGAILGKHFDNHDAKMIELKESTMNVSQLNRQLDNRELELIKLEQMIQEKMQFQMYFETGKDQLSDDDQSQIETLANFLAENDYMHVAIDGYADARGTDRYNQVLSEHRAFNVAELLAENGIEAHRISTHGHGARYSNGLSGDSEMYSVERKVKVQVFPSKESAGLASVD